MGGGILDGKSSHRSHSAEAKSKWVQVGFCASKSMAVNKSQMETVYSSYLLLCASVRKILEKGDRVSTVGSDTVGTGP